MKEADVRAALMIKLAAGQDAAADSRMIHELDLCQAAARVDLAVVNGLMTGWEIKTASDTLARLPRQQDVYSRVFDRMWLAAAPRHIEPALAQIPDWWGVVEIRGDSDAYRFRTVRRGKRNPSVDLHSLVRLLWRQETLEELRAIGLEDGMQRAPRRILWEALAQAAPRRLSKTALKERVRWRLKTRVGWRSDVPRT